MAERAVFEVETIELDLAPLVSALGRRLHRAGVPVTPARSADFADALVLVRPISRRRLYWTARAVFVTDPSQGQAFDSVFFSVFGGRADETFEPDSTSTVAAPPDERPRAPHRSSTDGSEERDRAPSLASTSPRGGDEDGTVIEVPLATASDDELLRQKSFDALEPHELADLYRLMSRMKLATPIRLTRRREQGRRRGERVDLRRTLRRSLRTAGDPIRLARRRRRVARRRLVLLCDISGSMEPYARAYLQFLACAVGAGPNAEAFVFATRLTRLTRALGSGSPERAIRSASAVAPDWSSGTRIGEALRTFNDRHGRRGMARGAVVVILSDGWERGDPALVGREMERLALLAHRIVWVNPRVSADEFSVRSGGMVAALPYCDAFVSGHSLEALGEVVDAIGAEHAVRTDRARDDSAAASDDPDPWPSATPVPGSSVAMPSGYGPKRGRTTPGWVVADEPGSDA